MHMNASFAQPNYSQVDQGLAQWYTSWSFDQSSTWGPAAGRNDVESRTVGVVFGEAGCLADRSFTPQMEVEP